MIFDKYVSLPVFLVALIVGFAFTYMTPSPMRKIVVYPTPDNKDEFLYQDSVNNCFSFVQEEVQCPADKSMIKQIPYQG